jgi:lysophospholipase L1-like esterase
MHVRMLARALVALALTTAGLLAGAALPAPAQAALAANYAALGDSYSSGVGAGPYDTSGCLRSQRSYPPLWVAAHATGTFRFVACGGAVTQDVLDEQISVLDAGTTLVTITIGGNDAGFADVVFSCQFGSDSACAAAVNRGRAFATAELPARLDRTYAAIRNRAPNAQLVVLGYPRLFELTRTCGLLGMSLYKRTIINEGADLLAQVISARAGVAGAAFVDTRSTFAGHGVCSARPWVNGIGALTGAYHPNATGYRSGYLAALTSVTG